MYMYPSTRMLAHSRAPHIFSHTYPADMTLAIQKLQWQLSRRESEGLAPVLPPRPAPCGLHLPPPPGPAKSPKSPPDPAPARQRRRLVKMVTQLSVCQHKAQRQQGVSLCRARDRHRLSDSGIFERLRQPMPLMLSSTANF
jgi:hypothetical protein